MAASDAACIGCVALSTRTTASATSIRRLTAVDTEDDDFGVWPKPSPSSSTSLAGRPLAQVGEKVLVAVQEGAIMAGHSRPLCPLCSGLTMPGRNASAAKGARRPPEWPPFCPPPTFLGSSACS